MAKSKKVPHGESLLVELLTEELPPKSLKRLSEAFSNGVLDGLKEKHFLSEQSNVESFATPRRLAVRISGVVTKQLDRVVERKGPSVQSGLDASGQPTQALLGFARSCGTDVSKLERRKDDKGEYFVYQLKQKGEPLANHLADVIEASLKKLPVAKLMRWGSGEAQFVRPVHGVIMLHGAKVVPGIVLGLKSGDKTLGHRFLSRGAVTIKRAADYENTLSAQGKVVASFEQRREIIERELDQAALKFGKNATWRLGKAEELIDEVTSIVESPRVYVGEFDAAFLEVPRECLIVSMQQHQKYFPVADAQGRLQPKFLFVANMHPKDASQIVHGNERVLRARLSDAKFFYDQDRKQKLDSFTAGLAHVVYHNKLGKQSDRVERIRKLAIDIARRLGTDESLVTRAAVLCKADLLTNMVGEFPELQGTMGRYYALESGDDPQVADAIEQHYRPRFAGDVLPEGPVAVALALADKLDTLVSIFGIGLIPTGEKDPFGLRRAAVGVLRIICEYKLSLDLYELLKVTHKNFDGLLVESHQQKGASVPNYVEVFNFITERARNYLRDQGYSVLEIESVLDLKPGPAEYVDRLVAVRRFLKLPEAASLAEADKRIRNIINKSNAAGVVERADESLLQDEAEKNLLRTVRLLREQVDVLLQSARFQEALLLTTKVHQSVTRFFDEVMVNVEDTRLRHNRFCLLHEVVNLTNRVANISKLAS